VGGIVKYRLTTKGKNMFKSKKYKEASKKLEIGRVYSLKEALELLPQTAITKFDSTVELHVKLGIDPKKGDQQLRGTVTLPNSFGKAKKIAVFTSSDADQKKAQAAGASIIGGEDLIKDIKQSGKADFDVAIATPDMMKHLAQVARILGPRGLMPSPKEDTVTTDIVKAINDLSKGKASFKNDATANVHMAVGKVSMTSEQLKENIEFLLNAIKAAKPETSKGTYLVSMTLATTMGPGIKFKA